MSYGARKGMWIRRFLNELLSKQAIKRMEMLGDNEISLILIRNPESQNRIKDIDMIYHYV